MFQSSKEKLAMIVRPVVNTLELEDLKTFLILSKLPCDDIDLRGNQFFLYYIGGALAGCGGLEFHGRHVLLRSVAVAPELRGKRYGIAIVEDLIKKAKSESTSSISLLTETAPSFFEKLGFTKVPRDNAPQEIKASSEFSSVCPVSAVFMSVDVEDS